MNTTRAAGIFFDLFDTLVEVDHARLPQLHVDGKSYPSTLPTLCRELSTMLPNIEFDRILTELFIELNNRPRRPSLTEHPSRTIFQNLLVRLGLPVNAELAKRALYLSDVQMRLTANAMCARPGAHQLLDALRRRGVPLAVVSNLDHSRGARWLLEAAGLADCFDCLIFSEDLGVRKPHRKVFQAALTALSLTPDCVTHVGDDVHADIWGAGRLGIQTVWINPSGRPLLTRRFPPALVVSSLNELLPYFG